MCPGGTEITLPLLPLGEFPFPLVFPELELEPEFEPLPDPEPPPLPSWPGSEGLSEQPLYIVPIGTRVATGIVVSYGIV